jgi:hypothetical protein
MRDAAMYKEAAEHGYALRYTDTGAHMIQLDTMERVELVQVTPEGVKLGLNEDWKTDFAHRLRRMIKAELDRSRRDEAIAEKTAEPILVGIEPEGETLGDKS